MRVAALALLLCAACAQDPLPTRFGVTMVEETTCIGQGGQIVEGPDGPKCSLE